MTILNIYTDGACAGNQNDNNYGGWGSILQFGENKKELCGGEINTTNNRMELTAVIKAFQAITIDDQSIQVFTDSSYVANCFREKWYIGWQKNGWVNSTKKPVENQDLWKELIDLTKKHKVSFFRVKGHVNLNHPSTNVNKLYEKFVSWNGNKFSYEDFVYITNMNNRADELANVGISQIKGVE